MKDFIDFPRTMLEADEAELKALAEGTETYSVDQVAAQLREGDLVNGLELAEKKLGTKWAHLKWDNGLTTKHPLDDPFTVERERGTETARHARRALHMREAAAKRVEEARALGETGVEKVIEEMRRDTVGKHWGASRALDHGASLAYAVTDRDIARTIVHVFDEGRDGLRGNAVASIVAVADSFAEELMSRHYRATSRSSSVTSNLAQDIEREVKSKFIDDLRWMW